MYLSIYKALPKTVQKNDEAISKHLKKKRTNKMNCFTKGKSSSWRRKEQIQEKKYLVFARK